LLASALGDIARARGMGDACLSLRDDKATMDVNGDGVVNSRDLIELIRGVRAQARQALQPVHTIPKR
jgi:hypothetical protein